VRERERGTLFFTGIMSGATSIILKFLLLS